MSVESRTERVGALEEAQGFSVTPEDELEPKLAQLRDDIERGGRVEEARASVKELEARWPEDPRVQHWARVLAPPVSRVVTEPDPRSRSFDRERAWLREHRDEYPGCWLALYEDRLIAADPDLKVVLTEARRALNGKGALLHRQPDQRNTGYVCPTITVRRA